MPDLPIEDYRRSVSEFTRLAADDFRRSGSTQEEQRAALIAMSSCSKPTAVAPTGTWIAESGETIELHKDGSFTLTNLPPNKLTGAQFVGELSGTYSVVDATHLKLEVITPAGQHSSTIEFLTSGSELVLREPGSEALTFHIKKE